MNDEQRITHVYTMSLVAMQGDRTAGTESRGTEKQRFCDALNQSFS